MKVIVELNIDIDKNKIYTTTELGEISNISVRSLQRLIKNGQLKYIEKIPPVHGGAQIKGEDFIEYFIRYYSKGDFIEKIEII